MSFEQSGEHVGLHVDQSIGQFVGQYHGAPAYALGLALALVLASLLTPAHWWRRPTARGLAILGGGAWAFGAVLLHFAVMATQSAAPPPSQADAFAQQRADLLPVSGQRYRVHRDLNVRGAAGVGSARLAVAPAGSFVTPTGRHQGDWWQIRYDGGPPGAVGWASSLWLRRAAEP